MPERYASDTVMRLETNLDDCTGEVLGAAMALLFEAGALDAWLTPIQMKKNRPGVMLSVLCDPRLAHEMTDLVFKHTTAFGIRQEMISRMKLDRSTEKVATEFGEIEVKIGMAAEGVVVRVSPEFESCHAAAKRHGVSVAQVQEAAIHGRANRG